MIGMILASARETGKRLVYYLGCAGIIILDLAVIVLLVIAIWKLWPF